MTNQYVSTLKKFTDFEGRATRTEYWTFILVIFFIGVILFALDIVLGFSTSEQAISGGLLSFIFGILVFIPSLSVSVRRLHDSGKSGWLLLVPTIVSIIGASLAMAGTILLILAVLSVIGVYLWISYLLLLKEGDVGTNEYGENPKYYQ